VIDLPRAFLTIARRVKAGTFAPGVISLGESDDVVTLVLNPTLESRVPPPMRARIDSLQRRMLAGQFTIGAELAHSAAKP
jgi:basic membrane lipoprotein Med (substrate-binding protein (PBP1-ABC) superfamily)